MMYKRLCGVKIPSHTRGKWACTPLSEHMDAYVYTFWPTNWQTNRQSFSKSRECVFLHLLMFIGIRFEWSALEALFVQTCSLHTVRLNYNIRGLFNKIWYPNHKLLVTVFSDLCQNKCRNSLCSFARTRTAVVRSLRYARLLAPFTRSLIHFAHSLVEQLKFMNVFML